MTTQANTSPIILGFSGGLDTSFCVPWMKEHYGRPVVTVTINTGGIDAAAARDLEKRAMALGAQEHVLVEARQVFFDRVLRYLIFGNVRRGHLYPLCVGAERGIQATLLAELAKARGSSTVGHGCTAAGNDQVRFEVALRTISPGLEVLAPVRDQAFIRTEQQQYLEQRGFPVPVRGSSYSINRGLWGVTIGGRETLDSRESIPESSWVLSANAFERNLPATRHTVAFTQGIPTALDGEPMDAVKLIETLETLAGPYGIGRGIHVGDTVLGTKGRVAFEAPAAEVLLVAHRELEKLTLSGPQQRVKDQVATQYGDFVHEGKQLDPVCRDIEALLSSSQQRVTGEVRLMFRPGNLFVEGVTSPHSLMAATKGVYGEKAGEWTPADALGYSRILSLPGILQTRAAGQGESQVKTVIADKIGSVAQHAQLSRELRVGADIPCEEGVLIAVEILNNKGTYNTLELTSGRQAQVKRGDVIVGALGHRKALFGYSGHLPEKVAVGDVLQVLNMGGVIGVCDSINASFGPPFEARVLGGVLDFPYLGERIGVPARAGAEKLDFDATLDTQGVPVVALAGTCMNAGKTAAACAIVSRLRHLGYTVDAFKSTGVALRRDILAMEDAGARKTMIFTDYGVVCTTAKTGPAVTRTMMTRLAANRPDVIVFELGDGILGAYGVEAILRQSDIKAALSCVVLSANDPVAAWGGVELLRREFDIDPKVVTGPATDNQVGRDIIRERTGVDAINAVTDAADLGNAVARSLGFRVTE